MALTQLAPPYPVFTDKNGDPLDNGYLYFGVVDLNPETNPDPSLLRQRSSHSPWHSPYGHQTAIQCVTAHLR
jgi:hypothetical protein